MRLSAASRGLQRPNRAVLRSASVRVLRGEPRVRSLVRECAERRDSTRRCAVSRETHTSTRLREIRRSGSVGAGGGRDITSTASGSASAVRSLAARGRDQRCGVAGSVSAYCGDFARARARVDSTPTSPSLDAISERAVCVSREWSPSHGGLRRWRGSTAPARVASGAARAFALPRRAHATRRRGSVCSCRTAAKMAPVSASAGGWFGGSVCAVARSIVRCAWGGVGGGRIASVRSASGDSTGRGARSAWTCARATTVVSPSSSMLDDDSARLERTRARVFSAGVDSIDRSQSGRSTNAFLRTNSNNKTSLATNRRNPTIAVTATAAANTSSSATSSGGEHDEDNRENDNRERREAEGDHAEQNEAANAKRWPTSRNTRIDCVFLEVRIRVELDTAPVVTRGILRSINLREYTIEKIIIIINATRRTK